MIDKRAKGKRTRNVLLAESVVRSIQVLRKEGTESTFNAIMRYLRSRRILSNHRSLREYLDFLVISGLLSVRMEPTRQPNMRPKQVYSVTHDGPFVEAGEKAMVFHGLNWTLPNTPSVKVRTDLEGVVRGRLQEGRLYASLEDTIVENLASIKGKKGIGLVLSYCAALLATKKVDRSYLMQRAGERGVSQITKELLGEIDYVFASSNPGSEDIKSLYAIRKWSQSIHRRLPPRLPQPNWSLLSEDELVDVVGKQLGVK